MPQQRKEPKTATEAIILGQEELHRQELRYWQRMHPDAKVTLKKNEIVITYPLPKDLDLISKYIKAL